MWPDWVLSPGPLALESDALPTALRGPATTREASSFLQELNVTKKDGKNKTGKVASSESLTSHLNPIALRKAKIAYNFGLSECNRVKCKECRQGAVYS